MKRPLAVLFDLDGTLVEYNIRGDEAKKEFINYIITYGFPEEEIDASLPLGVIIKQLSKASLETAKKLLNIANDIYRKYELEAAEAAKPREYAEETLSVLRDMKVRLGVTTNNSREAVIRTLMKTDLLRFIDVIVTRDDVTEIKPSPEMLIRAARLLKAPLNMCLHVGDSYVDVLAARSTGIMAIALKGGVATVDMLNKYCPHVILSDLKQIVPLIKDIICYD